MSKQTHVNDLRPIPKTSKQIRAVLQDDPIEEKDEKRWRVVTLVPRQQVHDIKGEPMKITMFKIRRPIYYSEKDAHDAIKTYWGVKEHFLPHHVYEEGTWDGFLDEEERQIMAINKNSYKTSNYVVKKVMGGFLKQNEEGRTDIEFRYDDSFSETKMWRQMKKWQHRMPDKTKEEIINPKDTTEKMRLEQVHMQSNQEAKQHAKDEEERQTMSTQRAKNEKHQEEYKTDENIMDVLNNLSKHKKESLAELKRKHEKRRAIQKKMNK
jgi:hypothetical protein